MHPGRSVLTELGESIEIALERRGSDLLVNDNGVLFFAMGRLGWIESENDLRLLETWVNDYLKYYGVLWNYEDKTAEQWLKPGEDEVWGVMSFIQVIGACMTTLPVVFNRPLADWEPEPATATRQER